jgi:CubicO group peptidase (beta-lactamase class C family)
MATSLPGNFSPNLMSRLLNSFAKSAGVTLAVLVFGGVVAFAQNKPTTPSDADVVGRVHEYMNALVKLNRFRGTILIARDGRVLTSTSYGLANLEDEVPNTRQTKFHLASITKTFTAMAVMMLHERGKLTLQDPICKYLTDCPAAWQAVSIHHLLTMSSGIPNFTDFPDWLQTRALPSNYANTIARFKDKPLDFQPGEKYNYSNSGYVLLAYITEKVSGKTYEAFLRENIFGPLKMEHTGYDDNKVILTHRALGYAREGIRIVRAPYLNTSIVKGAGGLYSTVDDLLLWDQALYQDKLVSKKSLETIFTVHKGDFGYGWHIDEQFKRRRIFYDGVIIGFKSSISRYPDERVCVILLTNSDDVFINSASRDLAAIVIGENYSLPKPRASVPQDPRIYDSYVGNYQLDSDLVMRVTREGNRLIAEADGRKFELLPETDTKFFVREYDAQIMFTFVKDEQGQVNHLIYNRTQRAPRLK